ncbi:uncharacterized protein A4U43_C07F16570 [Asparagus officinalis]|uniref:Uncharacterized protein n=1 Tax=Asparagus officinalis TaxID=4686 RepID=A0A5P1ECF8_ASPOF|nr:uncharacterized protein A4U43_C07F16570 [Asparagus officinalis]
MVAASTRLHFSSVSNTSIPKSHPFTAIKIKKISYPLRSANPNLSQSFSIDNEDNNNNFSGGGFGKCGRGSGGHDSGPAISNGLVAMKSWISGARLQAMCPVALDLVGGDVHEVHLRFAISSLNLLRVISDQEGNPIEELNAGRICDWFLKDKLKREQDFESAVLQWDDSNFHI